jgi:hypothetical protein
MLRMAAVDMKTAAAVGLAVAAVDMKAAVVAAGGTNL